MESNSVLKGLSYGGFASCVAEVVTAPIDVVKTRMQFSGGTSGTQYRGAFHAAGQVVKNEGARALFKGIQPALLRQSTYGAMRYGLYAPIRNAIGVDPNLPKSEIPIMPKIVAGAGAGAIGSFLCNPTDLIKIRMQVDGMGAGQAGKNRYRGLGHAFSTIVKEEGFLGLWKGVSPTCARATVLAAAELASYDEIKEQFLARGILEEGIGLHFATSLAAGFIATVAASPFDVVKSRVMGQPVGADGEGTLYRGVVDCFRKTAQHEGVGTFWKGFWPNFGRIGPHVVINFLVMEQLKIRFG
jgi:hypothetical protein